MRRLCCVLAILCWGWAGRGAELRFNFSEFKLNEAPPGFLSTVSGSGTPGVWKILLDDAPTIMPPISSKARVTNQRAVLAQVARDKTDEHFPILIYQEEDFDDFKLSTRFKLVEGEVEQMAGIVFRYRNPNNYYYVRASGLGGSFYFWKIVDGIRSPPIGVKTEIARGVWHEMTIECTANQIKTTLNGKELIPPLDDKTFSRGKIGFWTKSDSVTYFADFTMTYVPKEIFAQRLVREVWKQNPRLLGLKIFAPAGPDKELRVVANIKGEVGELATETEKDVVNRDRVYFGKKGGEVLVTLPLHDGDGETIGAVSVRMKSFPGQTEKNAIGRAVPIVKEMRARIRTLDELMH